MGIALLAVLGDDLIVIVAFVAVVLSAAAGSAACPLQRTVESLRQRKR